MRWLLVATTACLVVAACTLPSADEFAAGNADDGDAAGAPVAPPGNVPTDGGITPGIVDGGADASTTDATTTATDLLEGTGTFERASSCVTAGAILATFTEALGNDGNVVHGGTRSCRLCREETEGAFSIEHAFAARTGGAPRATYRAEAWVRKTPSGVPAVATLTLRTYQFFPFDDDVSQTKASSPVVVADDWQRLSVDLVVTQTNSKIEASVSFEAPRAAGTCALLDDVVLYRL